MNGTSILQEGLLLGVGNPLLDISASVDEEFLKKYDLKPNNAILAEEKHTPLYEELITHYKAEYIAGGSVQNALRVAQWLIEKPNVCTFFGSVGTDKYAKILEDVAKSAGVNVRYQHTDKQPTGTCGVLITGHDRSLCANLAAANCFTIDHIRKSENKKFIDCAKYIYISGFFLTVSPPTVQEIAEIVLAHNKTFIMNLSAPFISQFYKKPLMDALPYVDIVIGNDTEALTFAKEHNYGTENLHNIAVRMSNIPMKKINKTRSVIITQGNLPIICVQNGHAKEIPVMVIPKEKILDTNGAGDAFVGGLLSQLIQGQSLDICIKCGIWAATRTIQRSGCTFEGKPSFVV